MAATVSPRVEQINVKPLCRELSSYFTVCSYICKQGQTLDIYGCTHNQKLDRTHIQTQTLHVLGSAQPFFLLLAGSLSGLSKSWMETPHCSWQISTYLHYVCGDERREMDRFLLREREVHTSCTAMVFFSTEIWGEGQVKRLFSLG